MSPADLVAWQKENGLPKTLPGQFMMFMRKGSMIASAAADCTNGTMIYAIVEFPDAEKSALTPLDIFDLLLSQLVICLVAQARDARLELCV